MSTITNNYKRKKVKGFPNRTFSRPSQYRDTQINTQFELFVRDMYRPTKGNLFTRRYEFNQASCMLVFITQFGLNDERYQLAYMGHPLYTISRNGEVIKTVYRQLIFDLLQKQTLYQGCTFTKKPWRESSYKQ